MTIVGVFLAIGAFFLNIEEILKGDVIENIIFFIVFTVTEEVCILYLIFMLFNGFQKRYEYQTQIIKYKFNLKANELIEVTPIIKYDGCDLNICLEYCDRADIRYFAKLEGEGILVLILKNGKFEESDSIIENWCYFDNRFQRIE